MDRRTLLAFVLITLLLVAYQALAPKSPPPQQRPPAAQESPSSGTPQAASTESSRTEPGTLAPAAAAPGTFENTLVPAETGPAAKLAFTGDDYRAILDPKGGLIQSWILPKYTDSREEPADLVANAATGMFRLKLILPEGEVDFAGTSFAVERGTTADGETAVLTAKNPAGAQVRLAYEFPRSGYATKLNVQVDGVPSEGASFLQIEFPAGIAYPERDPKVDRTAAAGVALLGRRYLKHHLGRGGWSDQESGVVHWAGVRSKYFLVAAAPAQAPDGEVRMERAAGSQEIRTSLRLPLDLSGRSAFDFTVFAGPMSYAVLEGYDSGLEKAVDLGWRWLQPFTRLLLRFFLLVHKAIPNYGIVIIVLSALIKLVFYPLSKKSMDSMKQMQLLKPEIDKLNVKYKDDAQRRNQATLELYKKHKVNPMGGCLPVLIQMPVFVALYAVLNSSIELRKAPFISWIRDLSAPDRVGVIAGFPIHILPLLMAGTMLWQQKLTPTDPRQASIAYIMPIVMTIFFYPMPSGLVLYWTVTNLMAVGQQIWMNRTTTHQQLAA